jgi:SAM-dependent methyltransferase
LTQPAPEAPTESDFVPALRFRLLTPVYDMAIRLTMREGLLRPLIIQMLQLQPGMAVLDVGCGTGSLAIQIKHANPLVEVVGVDPDPDVLRIARTKAQRSGTPLDFTQGNAERLPFETRSFDVVVSSLAFHHLTPGAKEKALGEAFRVLKPGGRLTIADFGPPRTRIGLAATLPIRLLDGRTTWDNFFGRLPSMIRAAGFSDVSEVGRIRTVFGPVCFYTAMRPSELRGRSSAA